MELQMNSPSILIRFFALFSLAFFLSVPVFSQNPNVSISLIYNFSDEELASEIEKFKDAPYKSGGADIDGVDSVNLVRRTFGRVGVKLPSSIKDIWTFNGLVEIKTDELQFGDILFFRSSSDKTAPDQIAVCMGDGNMIVADAVKGRALTEKYNSKKWKEKLMGARRAPRHLDGTNDSSGEELDIQALKKAGGDYLGAPYRRGGRSKDGVDSSGLLLILFAKSGVSLPDGQTAIQFKSKKLQNSSLDNIKFGDILFFSSSDDSVPTHAAIYWDNRTMLRASETAGRVVLEIIDKPLWMNTLVGVKSYPKIKNHLKTKSHPKVKKTKEAASNEENLDGIDMDKLKRAGEKFIGAQVLKGAASTEAVDSSSLLYLVFKEAGVALPATPVHAQFMSSNLENVKYDSLRFGDILFFDTAGDGKVNHAGIYWGKNKMIHASSSAGKVILSDISIAYWKNVLVGAKRISKSE